MRILMPLVAMLLWFTTARGAEGTLYDELYNRPTHFPEWQQPTAWPNNMSYFIKVRMADGTQLTNYEIAVYDQHGTLRHCGRSIASQDDFCTLTIPGESGDSFTFQIIYGDFRSPTIVPANETCEFKVNAVVGIEEPFWLTPMTDEATIADVARLTRDLLNGTATNNPANDVNNDSFYNAADVKALADKVLKR